MSPNRMPNVPEHLTEGMATELMIDWLVEQVLHGPWLSTDRQGDVEIVKDRLSALYYGGAAPASSDELVPAAIWDARGIAPISDFECDQFEQHAANEDALVSHDNGGEYAMIQPGDLARFCRTVRAERRARELVERERDSFRSVLAALGHRTEQAASGQWTIHEHPAVEALAAPAPGGCVWVTDDASDATEAGYRVCGDPVANGGRFCALHAEAPGHMVAERELKARAWDLLRSYVDGSSGVPAIGAWDLDRFEQKAGLRQGSGATP